MLALRFELEQLDEAMRAGPAPGSARNALDYAFVHLRAAEHAWQECRRATDLDVVVARVDASRDALEAAVAVRAGRRRTHVRADA